MASDIIQQDYNKFSNLPYIPYSIISYLIDNNDLIFKLLKYTDSRAYEKPNLTLEEKGSLVYSGQPDSSSFRIFSDWGLDDSVLQEITILRISVLELIPTNYVFGYCTIGCEVYAHRKINIMSNYQIRTDVIIQQLIETLNGAEIPNLGRLYFDNRTNPRSKVTTIGSIPYKGKLLTICNHTLS